MSEKTAPAPPPATGEIVNVRVLAAPCAALFAAFADPNVLSRWWGPKGFTNEFHEFDFRPGGAWRFTMRAPDGTGYAMNHRFVEVTPAGRITVRHVQPGHDFLLTVELAERHGGTQLTWRQRFDDAAEGERLRGILTAANEQNLDRLAAQLSP